MRLLRVLFIPDCHFPFVDKKAFKVMLDVAQDFRPHRVVYLGDFDDIYSLSRHEKNPHRNFKFLEEELEAGRAARALVEKKTRCKDVIYLEGNHENRIDRYIAENAEKLGRSYTTKKILELPSYYRFLPYGQKGHYKIGNWVVTHGTLCGKNVCGAMVAKYGTNVLFGHTHRIQEFHTANFHGDQLKAITCGWLGDTAHAGDYVKNVAEWSHGFAIGYFTPGGKGYVQTVPVEDYRAVFNGRIY